MVLGRNVKKWIKIVLKNLLYICKGFFTFVKIFYMLNPFVSGRKIDVLRVISESFKVNSVDAIEGNALLSYRKERFAYHIEKQSRVGVYRFDDIDKELFKGLNSNGRDLLIYIIFNIGRNKDYINLKQSKVCEVMRTTRPTLTKGIRSLEENSIICRRGQSDYWVNPFCIFHGNRAKFYSEQDNDLIKVIGTITRKDDKYGLDNR